MSRVKVAVESLIKIVALGLRRSVTLKLVFVLLLFPELSFAKILIWYVPRLVNVEGVKVVLLIVMLELKIRVPFGAVMLV